MRIESQKTKQAVLATDATLDTDQMSERLAIFTEEGELFVPSNALPDPRDPAIPRRQKVVNGFTNPVAGTNLTGASLGGGGGTLARLTGLTPPTDAPEVTTAYQISGTPSTNPSLTFGGAAAPIAADSSETPATPALVYVAAMVRSPTVVAGAEVHLYVTYTDAANVAIGAVDVAMKKLVAGSGWTLIEGFALTTSATRRAQAVLNVFGTVGSPIDFQATLITVVANPTGSVPVLPCGSRLGHTWVGTAHASASYAYALSKVDQPRGFNDNSATYSEASVHTEDLAVIENVGLTVELGSTHARFGVNPTTTLTPAPWPGRYDPIDWKPTYLGKYLDKFREMGLKAIPEIGNAPSWFTNVWRGNMTDAEYADLGKLYAQLVYQYRDVIEAVEVGNENNAANYWGNPVSPTRYVACITAIYNAIKEVAPDMVVLAGAMSPYTGAQSDSVAHDYDAWLTNCYAAGLADVCDAVSLHPYPVATHTGRDATNTLFADGFNEAIRKTLAIMDFYGDTDKKLWITEFGLPTDGSTTPLNVTVTERQQASMLALLVGIASRNPRVGSVVIHELFATGTTGRWGIVSWPKLRRRQAFYSIQQAFGKAPAPTVWSPWRYVGTVDEPVVFQANWANVVSSHENLRFRENGQTVQLRGKIKRTGTAVAGENVIFLPSGSGGDADLRPRQTISGMCSGYTSPSGPYVAGELQINPTTGGVQWQSGDPSISYVVNLDFPLT